MENFIYDIKTKILFGQGLIDQVGSEIASIDKKRVLLVYGKESIKKIGLYDQVINSLKANHIEWVELSGVKPNPSIQSVRLGKQLIQENNLDFILAVGGGSVIDCSKAIAAAVYYDGDPWDFFIKKAEPVNGVPIGTILTLAATGSEMNTGAVISNEETQEKLSFGHPSLRPVFTFEDPTLMYSLPKYQTAAGASDIMAHLLEQYFNDHQDGGINDRLTEALMINVMDYARKAIDMPNDYEARANLMWNSSLALNGILTKGKLGGDWATHGIEHEVSAIYDITHGAGLAILFPSVLTTYLNKDIEKNESLVKFTNLAKNVFKLDHQDQQTLAKAGIEALAQFFKSIDMPSTLKEENVGDKDLEVMAKGATRYGTIGVYHRLTKDEVVEIYKRCL